MLAAAMCTTRKPLIALLRGRRWVLVHGGCSLECVCGEGRGLLYACVLVRSRRVRLLSPSVSPGGILHSGCGCEDVTCTGASPSWHEFILQCVSDAFCPAELFGPLSLSLSRLYATRGEEEGESFGSMVLCCLRKGELRGRRCRRFVRPPFFFRLRAPESRERTLRCGQELLRTSGNEAASYERSPDSLTPRSVLASAKGGPYRLPE